jgi:pilus assembly protein CpaD
MAIFKVRSLLCAISLPLLASCSPSYDLQGHDPQEYYAAHPRENKVETRHFQTGLQFKNSQTWLASAIIASLHNDLADINPRAIDKISIGSNPNTAFKSERMKYVTALLHKTGFTVKPEYFTQRDLPHNKIVIDIAYAAIIPPDCPDWKMSPVTTYSNMPPANFGCATKTNLGMMLDDPRDLERGKGSSSSPSERGAKAVLDYRMGTTPASSASTSITGQ